MFDSLSAISRRRFLIRSLAGVSAALVTPPLFAATPQRDPNRFALFSDTHIAADRNLVAHGTNVAEHFAQAVKEVLQCDPRPEAVLVCGDCAYSQGKTEDYQVLAELIQPLRTAGVPIHFAMGNHDNRERFEEIVEKGMSRRSPLPNRHITVVEAPLANWFLLDSLDQTNKTPGVLGKEQLRWLADALDQRKDKPAMVMVHHNPDPRPKPTGLVETKELLQLLAARPFVEVLFYGHSHHWNVTRHKNLHLVNLPALAYVFGKNDPSGWVDARIDNKGISLTLRCIDQKDPRHGKTTTLKWTAPQLQPAGSR